jgi:hypothetical protein
MQHCSTPTNCHSHVLNQWVGVAGGSFVAPDHEYPSYLELQLTATDADGLTSTVVRRLDPKTVVLTFATGPTGLQLSVGSTTLATPFTQTVIQGSTITMSAPGPQRLKGKWYYFSGWSDGGAQTHTVTASGTPTTYSATYTRGPRP